MEKLKRKAITLKDKYEMIKKIENGVTQAELAVQLNLPKSTVSVTWRRRHEILAAYYGNVNASCKKLRKSLHDELDKELLQWCRKKAQENVLISRVILRKKASEICSQIEDENFRCSRSWLERFIKRNGISVATKFEVNADHEWFNTIWSHLYKNYRDENIFNAEETGVFYKVTPGEMVQFKEAKCENGEMPEFRITVFLAANKSGTEKRRLFIIGESEKPEVFKNNYLPIKYKANSKALMTANLFTEELHQWDSELRAKNREILLLVNSSQAHPNIQLNKIKLVLMCKLQPLNQGVVYSLKSHYRQIMLTHILEEIDKEESYLIGLPDAINFIHQAWQKVDETTIANSFTLSNLFKDDKEVQLPAKLTLEETFKVKMEKQWSNFDFEEYVRIDDNVKTVEILTEEEIIQSVDTTLDVGKEEQDSDLESELNVSITIPSIKEMHEKMIETRHFLESNEVPDEVWNSFCILESFIIDVLRNTSSCSSST